MMKTKKKNKFLSFCFSFIPGAGEMYMGFMKQGVSLMLLFVVTTFVPASLHLEVLAMIGFVVWCYGFFHANHLASLSDEEFAEVEDDYILHLDDFAKVVKEKNFYKSGNKVFAVLLIGLGVILLWQTGVDLLRPYLAEAVLHLLYTIGEFVPRVLVSVVIIMIGVKMIVGKKKVLEEKIDETENNSH